MLIHCSDPYRDDDASDTVEHDTLEHDALEHDSLERMKPEDVYDSIRRTTADIRQYVKMESNTASPPTPRTTTTMSQRQVSGCRDGSGSGGGSAGIASYHLPERRDGGGSSGAGIGSYQLPVVRSPDTRGRQQYNVVSYRDHVYVLQRFVAVI